MCKENRFVCESEKNNWRLASRKSFGRKKLQLKHLGDLVFQGSSFFYPIIPWFWQWLFSSIKHAGKDKNNLAGANLSKMACQRYWEWYEGILLCLGKSKKVEMYVFCSTCECDFSCPHGGKGDCIQHVKSKSNLDIEKMKMTQKSSFCKTA
jgi:hypothetical protein